MLVSRLILGTRECKVVLCQRNKMKNDSSSLTHTYSQCMHVLHTYIQIYTCCHMHVKMSILIETLAKIYQLDH